MQTKDPDLSVFVPRIREAMREPMQKLGTYSEADCAKVAGEFIDFKRIREQYALLSRYAGDLTGKRVLEVGSGYGMFTVYGNLYMNCRVEGLEPADKDYHETYDFSMDLLHFFDLDKTLIRTGYGEAMPYADESFDVVYSSNVLEHVNDPKKVLQESLRVLKPGGFLQMVVPNYGSLWEGHYYLPWIPYMTPGIARLYVRLFGRNPEPLERIRLVNCFSLKKILKPYVRSGRIEILTWGEDVFRERMFSADFSDWAGLKTVKSWVRWAHRLRVIHALTALFIFAKAQTPIILTLKKKT